jgi:putative tricarboxylic transport membrane protein
MQGERAAGDFWSGLALTALGAFIVNRALGWEYLGPDGPGPGFFPFWCGLAMAALAAVLVASSLWSRRTILAARLPTAETRRAVGAWLALAVSIAAIEWLGFVLSYALLVYFVAAALYRRRPLHSAALAGACAAGFHLLFVRALGVPLPAGALGF